MKRICLILITLFVLPAIASDQFRWKNQDGTAIEQRENQQSKEGFGGLLLVTPDKDWLKKWVTPPEHVPRFTTTREASIGDELNILSFFANPMLDDERQFKILCDIRVIRPDDSISINESDIPCAVGTLETSPMSVFMTQASIMFIGEPNDPLGEWTIEVTLTDANRGVTLPLKTSFMLME